MGFSEIEGYIPLTIEEIMGEFLIGVNEQFGTSYTIETFIGTNLYKYFYVLAQKVQSNEVKLSEIFLKLQQYIIETNQKISNPKTTFNGLIAAFEDAGYKASIKPLTSGTAGILSVCVDIDNTDPDYATIKESLNQILKDYTVAGPTFDGAESSNKVLSNGQTFAFSYHLPTRINMYLTLTITTSRNNQHLIDSPEDIKTKLLENLASKYQLGKDFEPEIYFTSEDAPYAGDIKLEYSFDDITYYTAIINTDFDDLYEFDLSRITIIQV